MAFGTWACGPYTATYNGNDVGLIEGVWRHQQTAEAADIRSGRFGDSVIDGIYRGGNCFAVAVFKEWTANIRRMLWPFDTVLGDSGKHGRSMVDMSSVLLLTAIAGTPAATAGPATRSFPRAIFSPGHNKEVLLGNEERNVPIVFRCYPTVVTPGDTDLRWYTDT